MKGMNSERLGSGARARMEEKESVVEILSGRGGLGVSIRAEGGWGRIVMVGR